MPSRDGAAGTAQALARRRRLHPMAIVMPFGSYSRPPRLGRGLRIPRWLVITVLAVLILIVDFFSKSVSVTEDGGVNIRRDDFGTLDATVLTFGLAAAATYLLVRWWTFRWWVENDSIWTTGGVLNTWRRRVTFGHIVTVDRTSTPLRRLFGVSRIAIETTAVDSAAPDVLLGFLSKKDSHLLEELLITELVFHGEKHEAQRLDPIDVDRLSWRELFVAGATTIQIARALVVLYVTYRLLLDTDSPTPEVIIDTETSGWGLSPSLFITAQLLALVVIIWLTSTLYFVASFTRFRLAKHGGWLIIQTGVIRKSRRLIKVGAIEGLEIHRSPLQRYFRNKRAMLRMRMPAYGAPSIYAMVLHPAVTDAALPTLTSQIAGMDLATSGAMCGHGIHRLAAASRGAYVLYWPMRLAVLCGVLLLALLALQPDRWWWALTPMVLAPPLGYLGALAWRSAGWYADHGDWLVVQRGMLGLTSTAAHVDHINYLVWSRALVNSSNGIAALAFAVPTSGALSLGNRLLAVLHRATDPSIIRIRAMAVSDARAIAVSSGFERSLPPDWTA